MESISLATMIQSNNHSIYIKKYLDRIKNWFQFKHCLYICVPIQTEINYTHTHITNFPTIFYFRIQCNKLIYN